MKSRIDTHLAARIQFAGLDSFDESPTPLHQYSQQQQKSNLFSSTSSSSSTPPPPPLSSRNADLSASSNGTPTTIIKDRQWSSKLSALSQKMKTDVVDALLHQQQYQQQLEHHQQQQESRKQQLEDEGDRLLHTVDIEGTNNILQYSTHELSEMIEEMRTILSKCRKSSSIPLTICSFDGALETLNQSLLVFREEITKMKDTVNVMQKQKQEKEKEEELEKERLLLSLEEEEQQRKNVNDNKKSPSSVHYSNNTPSKNRQKIFQYFQQHHHHHHHENKNTSSDFTTTTVSPSRKKIHEAEVALLKKEIQSLQTNEIKLLSRVRDLEVDVKVKSHLVLETTARANDIFKTNEILSEIAEHNERLMCENDSLKRCCLENDQLLSDLDVERKTVSLQRKNIEKLRNEVRSLRNQLYYSEQQGVSQLKEKDEEKAKEQDKDEAEKKEDV